MVTSFKGSSPSSHSFQGISLGMYLRPNSLPLILDLSANFPISKIRVYDSALFGSTKEKSEKNEEHEGNICITYSEIRTYIE